MNNELIEKYHIVYENGKRYYEFDMTEKLPMFDDTVPYLFQYKDIKIYESSWNRMTIKILEALDSINKKTEEELLSIHYSWSKQDVFSRTKKTNYTPSRGIFLNTNHSSCRAMMSIQCLLGAYGIKLNECYFLIRRHFIYEPAEVKAYIRSKTENDFRKYLLLKNFDSKRIETIIKNFEVINKYLEKASSSYNDFWLFDDYYYFTNYKAKTIDEFKKRMTKDNKNFNIAVRCLGYLDDFYKNRQVFDWLENNTVEQKFLDLLTKELDYLFDVLKSDIVVCNKIYGRMSLLHNKEMALLNEMNTPNGLFKIISTLLNDKYYCKKFYISKNPIGNLTNNQIILSYVNSLDEFSISELKAYIDKMHLKKLDNYMSFIEDISDSFVQIDEETLVSKERFEMNTIAVEELKKEICYYINSFGHINSESFAGFNSLPKLRYEWNKFLLMGIVRTYLFDTFSVKTSGANYKNISYIIDIKRISAI